MSKELEALKELRFEGLTEEYRNKCCDVIETALKDYEEVKFENSELKTYNYELYEEINDDFKKIKALQIIKEKKVDVSWLFYVSFCGNRGLQSYNEHHKKSLTQEEFDLLKEVLECDHIK